jgi:sodium-dependent dicarboxylate transporter 2/3/5
MIISSSPDPAPPQWRQRLGLVLGLVVALGLQTLALPVGLIEITGGEEPARSAWIVLSLMALMAIWWVTEAIPIPVTSLLPLVVLPFLGVQGVATTSAEYFHPIVVLLMGGFIVAKALERWNLHARIALNIVSRSGGRPAALVAGFMIAAAALSMWISNTATAIMMTPIAVSVAAAVIGRDMRSSPFTWALLLGIAYACSIGGLGTYIGTPTNLLIKNQIEASLGTTISFTDWMMFGVPAVILLLPAAWFVLTRLAFRLEKVDAIQGQTVIQEQLSALGRLSQPEIRTIAVFGTVAALWIFKDPLTQVSVAGRTPFAGLNDYVTAIFGVVLCFLVPSGSREERGTAILDWKTAESIPWGVILLFGGGMALAAAISDSGLGRWVGGELDVFADMPVILIVLLVTIVIIFVTEVTSNVATAAAAMPVLVEMAGHNNIDVALLGAPVALAASCAFMLPMATGPNAVVYATGCVEVSSMMKAGFQLNLIAIVIIVALSLVVTPFAFG